MLKTIKLDRRHVPAKDIRALARDAEEAGLEEAADLLHYIADRFEGGPTPSRRWDCMTPEIEFLVEAGASVDQIVRAVDASPVAIAQAMRRRGRHDLARPFDREVNRRRRAA